MNCKLHFAKPDCLRDLFLTINRYLVDALVVVSTKAADWTNMPPEHNAGSKMRAW